MSICNSNFIECIIFFTETDITIEVTMRKIERNIHPLFNEEEREVLVRGNHNEKR